MTESASNTSYVKPFLHEQGWKYDAFLCHTGKDKHFVRCVYNEMLRRQIVAFFDVESLTGGERIQVTIADAIQMSPFFVVVLSHYFKDQRYPEAEAEAALAFDEANIKILPVFYGMTADECCDSKNRICNQMSSYTGIERKMTTDENFAIEVAKFVERKVQEQWREGKLKVCRLCDFCGNYIYKTDLGPLKELKDKHLQRKQKYTWVYWIISLLSLLFLATVFCVFRQSSVKLSQTGNIGEVAIFPSKYEKHHFPIFVGREIELKNITNAFWKAGKRVDLQQMYIIGMGGCGKTSLAAAYARECRHLYGGGVFVFNAQSYSSFQHSLRNHLNDLAVHTQSDVDISSSFTQFILLLAKRGSVLLVYDGADNLDVIDDYMPNLRTKCHILVTTRMSKHELLQPGNYILLKPLNQSLALTVLLYYSGYGDSSKLPESELESAWRIANDPPVESLPLALKHVGRYLEKTGMNFSTYLHRLQIRLEKMKMLMNSNLEELLRYWRMMHVKEVLKAENINNVGAFKTKDLQSLVNKIDSDDIKMLTLMQQRLLSNSHASIPWEMNIEDVLLSGDSDAMNVLITVSLLHSTNISLDLLREVTIPMSNDEIGHNNRITAAVNHLSECTLVEVNKESNTCSMHNLVQQAVVEYAMRNKTYISRLQFLCSYFTIIFSHTEKARSHLREFYTLSLHVYSVAEAVLESDLLLGQTCRQLVRIACWLAMYYEHLQTAEFLTKRRLEVVETMSSNELQFQHSRLLNECLIDLGYVYEMLDKPKIALTYLTRSLESMENSKGKVLFSDLIREARHNVANCRRLLAQFSLAEEVLLPQLEFDKTQRDKTNTARSLNDLGLVYENWGKLVRAIEMFEKSLNLKKELNGSLSLDYTTSIALTNLAGCYLSIGRLAEARDLYEKAMKIRQNVLPSPHPRLALAMRRLAYCYCMQGDVLNGTKLAQAALDMIILFFPRSHPRVGWYFATIAYCCFISNNSTFSIEFYVKAMELFQGNDIFETHSLLSARKGLALALSSVGKKDEAMEILRESLTLLKKELPEGYPVIVHTTVDLAGCLAETGDYENATHLLTKSLLVLRDNEPTSEYTAKALYWLAYSQNKLKRPEEAAVSITECLRLRRKIFSSGHVTITETITLLDEIFKIKQGVWCCPFLDFLILYCAWFTIVHVMKRLIFSVC
ncbi:uncharacterized protein LOC134192152 isoform X2 [Corticium candelabrum]|uniref:uncharacterized protein LOC134192152 isoform X2 n=1 Tax=Corticium candelabrum TaxID=121492 RepID=UPI002E2534C0|nr:uncharacterized protein LOC134192152 isoform X2 [Corticium candelabrum]